MTRREWTFSMAAAAAAAAPASSLVERNDEAVERYLRTQATEGRWAGGVPDEYGIYITGTSGGVINTCTASYVHPASRFRGDERVKKAIRLAAEHLSKCQTADGNIDLETTNFNSPPDTGFVTWNVAEAASVARRYKAADVEQMLWPFLEGAARGMTKGGIHTPNHRWVVCSALAQIHALDSKPEFLRRIEQWLTEGIDIDSDGQFHERSTAIYNSICDRSFTVMAAKLNRPDLLAPVRKNLEAMLYLLHADGEVVTEISRRQDLNQRGTIARYWFPLAMMGLRDSNPVFWGVAKSVENEGGSLPALLDYPELQQTGPAPQSPPDRYRKHFREIGLVRERRGLTSASILLGGTSRFFTLRHGGAIIEAVRFASAFFGKGQFVPTEVREDGNSWVLTQSLTGVYYQPLDAKVDDWGAARARRQTSEVCRLTQTAVITPTPKGYRVRMSAAGTPGVPLTVEIGAREGARISGARRLTSGAWLMDQSPAVIEAGGHAIRISPGIAEHRWVQLRGAEAKLPGESLYLTSFTPFDHTIELEVG